MEIKRCNRNPFFLRILPMTAHSLMEIPFALEYQKRMSLNFAIHF